MSSEYEVCTQGPCWDGYLCWTEPRTRGLYEKVKRVREKESETMSR